MTFKRGFTIFTSEFLLSFGSFTNYNGSKGVKKLLLTMLEFENRKSPVYEAKSFQVGLTDIKSTAALLVFLPQFQTAVYRNFLKRY